MEERRVLESRYMILLAGVLGVLAIFQPMIAIGRGPIRVKASAYELSFGYKRLHKEIDRELPALVQKRIPRDVLETRDDIKLVADASRGAVLAFVPAALLLLLGGFAVWRKRTHVAVAVGAMVLALASLAAWLGVRYGVAYGIKEEPALGRLHLELQFSSHVLMIGAVLVFVGLGGDLLRSRARK
jgi:hypothetical protein